MGINIQSVDQSIQRSGVKCLVYGLLGSGKTVLCATPALHGQRILIGNAEGGLLSLQDFPKEAKALIDVVKLDTLSDIAELHEMLEVAVESEDQERVYDWVCLDSISEIADKVLENEKRNNSDPRKAYGNLADIIFEMLRGFRDLPEYNICMSAKMTRHTDDVTNRTMYWPLMPGKQLTNGIGYLFDEVFALRVETDEDGDENRWLQTSRDIYYDAKDRSGRLEMFEEADLYEVAEKISTELPEDEAQEEQEQQEEPQDEPESNENENESEEA